MSQPTTKPVTLSRTTKETDINLTFGIGYAESASIKSGVPFFDHMLHSFAFHGNFLLKLATVGDIEVDYHHTIEDIGLVLGMAIGKLMAEPVVRERFGHAMVPMDDSLATSAIDLCGRPFLVYQAQYPQALIGSFDCCLVKEFFGGVISRANINAHIILHHCANSHHGVEAVFKSFGRALWSALSPNSRHHTTPSTKGTLSA